MKPHWFESAPLGLLVLASCGQPAAPVGPSPDPAPPKTEAWFREVGVASGLPQDTWGRDTEPRAILEVKGGGFGMLDFDRDGHLDLFLPGGKSLASESEGPHAALFRNLGALRFEPLDAGLDWHGWAMGVSAGDLDGNGWDDLFVAAHGPNAVFFNVEGEGGRQLDERAEAAGLDDEAWGMAAALADLDADGDLDIYLVNYLELDVQNLPADIRFQDEPIFAGPLGLTPASDRIYENLGDGRFQDKSFRSGIGVAPASFGLGVTALDFDADGALDVFVGNDSMSNFLFRNLGGLRFEELGLPRGLAANGDGRRQATMGIAVGDVNADGAPDLFTTNFASDTNTLQVSRPPKAWRDRTAAMGLSAVGQLGVGWAALFGDFDLDGDEDLAVFNGHVYPDRIAKKMGSSAAQEALFFERGPKRFTQVSAERLGAWANVPHIDRGGARADLDGDGDLELCIQEWRGPLRILEGLAADPDHQQLEVTLERPVVGDSHGYGSRVELLEDGKGRTAWVQPTMGFQSSGSPAVSFALTPGATRRELLVTWPDGQEQRLEVLTTARSQRVLRAD